MFSGEENFLSSWFSSPFFLFHQIFPVFLVSGISGEIFLNGSLGFLGGCVDFLFRFVDKTVNIALVVGVIKISRSGDCGKNDENDNRFYEPLGRFSEIEEDEPKCQPLCNEYPEF